MINHPDVQSLPNLYLGVDPGWKNLGVAMLKEEPLGLQLVWSQTLCPANFNDPVVFAHENTGWFAYPCHYTIERYVSYENVYTAETERICMLIGALGAVRLAVKSAWEDTTSEWGLATSQQLRAIDWKTTLAKLLFKHRGFRNPSKDLDKTFSFAAARACLDLSAETELSKMKQLTPTKVITDHEADAICLAALPFFQQLEAQRRLPANPTDGATS